MHEPTSVTQPVSPAASTAGGSRSSRRRGFFFYAGWTFALLAAAALLTLGATALWYRHYFHAKPFQPVQLTAAEEQVVEKKIEALNPPDATLPPGAAPGPEERIPGNVGGDAEAADDLARRTLVFTEKEINGLLNHNTDLGQYLTIELDRGQIAAKAIVPFAEDVPLVGGKTLRVSLGLQTYLDDAHRLAIVIRDVSVGGVPLPSAWLGGLKGTNIVDQYSSDYGLLKAFADGIQEFDVRDGRLTVILNH